MSRKCFMSDHYDNWSDNGSKDSFSAAQTAPTAHPVTPAGVALARFAHRALQALWKAGMQVFEGAWTWTQVLPFSQPKRGSAPDGLCTSGLLRSGPRVVVQLPPSTPDSGRDLSDQPRAVAPSRTALRRTYGGHDRKANTGSDDGRYPGCQYARGLVGEPSRPLLPGGLP